MSFGYANAGSGPSAGGIGWFNFDNLVMNPGDSVTGLTGTLKDGTTVTFDLSVSNISGVSRTFTATQTPTWVGTYFGNGYYTAIPGRAAFLTSLVFAPSSNTVTISNIVVKDAGGNPIPEYTVVVADAESTGATESWTWNSDGDPWKLFATLGLNGGTPTLTGIGTNSVTVAGNDANPIQKSYLVTSNNPKTLVLNTATTSINGGQEAFALGFVTTKLKLQKYVGERIDSNDQFVLNIGGTPNDTATTTGGASGLQTQVAEIWATPGNAYTISEAMAPGSGSLLTDYTVVTMASNATPAGTVPPVGSLPITFTPALGDDVTYTILNAAPQSFTKSVDKAYADLGEVLTYTVTVNNPNNYPINNVLVTDSTPIGTTYVGNLNVSAPFTGTSPNTGITITTIAANSFVTISWQVQVNEATPITNPIVNMAMVSVPGGTSGNSNLVTTQIRHADLTTAGNILKTVDKIYATTGEILSYGITLHNTGNAAANNVLVTDIVPTGTVYIPGSVTASVPFSGDPTGTIKLIGPIPAGGTATINFNVKISDTVPSVNPIPNTASASYTYTVDPTNPNGVSDTGTSNTVNTLVSLAKLDVIKSVDKEIAYLGDIVTYSFAITNTGNVPANAVVLSDVLPNGVAYVPGSLIVSVPYTNTPPSSILLTNAIAPGKTVSVSFKVKVTSMPVPNPLLNTGKASYTYTVDPTKPNGVSSVATSNQVQTIVFRNNFGQQITDIINSVANEEAALAAIANAEGAKIQAIVAMDDVTTNQLLCLNKSVADMSESLALLEKILKKKIDVLNCQINGACM